MREIVVAKLIIWQFMLVSSIPYLIEFSWADFLAYPNKCIHILINYPTDGRTHDMLCWTNFASTMKYLMLNIIKRGIWHNVSQEVSSCTTYFAAIQMTALQWHGTIFLIDAVALFKSYECTYLFNPHRNPVQFLAVISVLNLYIWYVFWWPVYKKKNGKRTHLVHKAEHASVCQPHILIISSFSWWRKGSGQLFSYQSTLSLVSQMV